MLGEGTSEPTSRAWASFRERGHSWRLTGHQWLAVRRASSTGKRGRGSVGKAPQYPQQARQAHRPQGSWRATPGARFVSCSCGSVCSALDTFARGIRGAAHPLFAQTWRVQGHRHSADNPTIGQGHWLLPRAMQSPGGVCAAGTQYWDQISLVEMALCLCLAQLSELPQSRQSLTGLREPLPAGSPEAGRGLRFETPQGHGV